MTNEEAASKIFKQLLDDEWFMSYGQRNDDCVDYCIAARLQNMDEEEAFNQLIDWAYAKHHDLVEHGKMQVIPQYLRELCEDHFNRIWPYAGVWVKREEWQEKLLHDYGFDFED